MNILINILIAILGSETIKVVAKRAEDIEFIRANQGVTNGL